VSHGGVFRYIDPLVEGDELVFRTDTGTYTYRVTSIQVVLPDAVWIVDPTPTPTATLFACHPPGSVSQRIVVTAELVT
jgi:sortase A